MNIIKKFFKNREKLEIEFYISIKNEYDKYLDGLGNITESEIKRLSYRWLSEKNIGFKGVAYIRKNNIDQLVDIIKKDYEVRYNSFVSKLEERTGGIIDTSNLLINEEGFLNGTVLGNKNNVSIQSYSFNKCVPTFKAIISVRGGENV